MLRCVGLSINNVLWIEMMDSEMAQYAITDRASIPFEKIGNLSSDAIFAYDTVARRFKYTNASFRDLVFLTNESLEQQPSTAISRIVDSDLNYLQTKYGELLIKHSLLNVELAIRTPNVPVRQLSCDGYYLSDEGMVIGIVKDISKPKEHLNYIINYGAKKDSLLEMLSHNLSGPLNLSQRVLSLMDKTLRKGDVHSVSGHLEFIRSTTQHCIDIILDFLKEEHFLSERIYVNKNRFDVIEKIDAIVERFRQSYLDRPLRVSTNLKNLYVSGDDVKFMQIINNLLSNAVKFTPANCDIEILIQETGEMFVVMVKDDGIGIPAHLQPLIFQKYTLAGRTGLNGEKSIGVGLAIVKELVSLMKGDIRFESQENKGTAFFLTLPKE
jgi:two-component system, OmpR family, sensor histidine kinase VicK